MIRTLSLSVMVFTALIYSCKRTYQTSETDSLTNVEEAATGKQLSKNSRCFGSHKVNAGIALPPSAILGVQSTEQKNVIIDALSAVPASITFAFFSGLSGTVRMVDAIAQECGDTQSISEETKVDGCLKMEPHTQELAILLAPSTPAIHATMTRAFGQFYMVGGSQATILNDAINLVEADAATQSYWSNLKNTAIRELQARPNIDAGALTKIQAMPASVLYPEAFDSYHCSVEQREKERKSFPLSIALIEQEANSIAKIDAALIRALTTRDTSGFDALDKNHLAPSTRRFADVVKWLAQKHLSTDYAGPSFGLAKAPYVQYQGGQPVRNVGRFGFNVLRGGANLFRTK